MTSTQVQLRLAACGVVLAAAGRLLAELKPVVEWHRTAILPTLAGVLQTLSGSGASTIGEPLAMVLIGLSIVALVLRPRRLTGALALAFGLTVFGFYAVWGLAYRYPLLTSRLAPWKAEPEPEAAAPRLVELTEQAARLVALAAAASPDFSGDEARLLARINTGLNQGLARLPEVIEAAPVRGIRFGPAKLSRVSFALSRLQLSGYYFPWTGEAQINAEMPRTQWPRVAAHEKAHQRGFARENEATVIGVLTCLSSGDEAVFYAGTLGLFVGFDRELARVDRAERRRIWSTLPPRAIADYETEAAFWRAHEGVAGQVSEKVNDTYLKAQGVASGISSYGETTRLMLQAVDTPSLGLGRLLKSSRPEASPK